MGTPGRSDGRTPTARSDKRRSQSRLTPEDAKDARGRTIKPRPIEKIAKAAEDAADRFCLEVELELAKGNSTSAMTGKGERFRDVAELMQTANAHTWKPKTCRDTKAGFEHHIYPTFGNRRISQIKTMDVEAWLADQRAATSPKTKRPYSQSSIGSRYVVLASVFKYAVQLRLIGVDPCIPVRIPKVQHHELIFLAPEQVNAVVVALDAEEPDGLVQFAAYTGLRAGELMGLRIRDVNLFARQPYVHVQRQAQYGPKVGWQYITPKSVKSIRKVPLPPGSGAPPPRARRQSSTP